MKQYLSYGAGVGSTALIVHLLPEIKKGNIEIVFCDHGGDYPETYEYVDYIRGALDIPITVLKVDIEGKGDLYSYFWVNEMIPLRAWRICTSKAKIRPFNAYIKTPCVSYLGITWDEKQRARPNRDKEIENKYPFVDLEITRDHAIKIIERAGLKVPMRSGCWFCPMQKYEQWEKLYYNHPDLFLKAIELEERAILKRPGSKLLPDKGAKKLSNKSLRQLYNSFKFQSKLKF